MQTFILFYRLSPQQLMSRLVIIFLLLSWAKLSLGADETIETDRNNSALHSNIRLTPNEKAWA